MINIIWSMPYLVKVTDKRWELYGFSSFRIIEIMTFFSSFHLENHPKQQRTQEQTVRSFCFYQINIYGYERLGKKMNDLTWKKKVESQRRNIDPENLRNSQELEILKQKLEWIKTDMILKIFKKSIRTSDTQSHLLPLS